MIGVPYELSHDDNSPLDLVEEFVEQKGWKFTRVDDMTLDIALPGHKASYDVCVEWQEEFSAILIACALPIKIDPANYEMAVQALEKINASLWLGHFDLSTQHHMPTYRHTMLLRLVPAGISVELVADILDLAIAECNRFFSTFERAGDGDVRLHEDLSAAVFETVGEA